MSKGNLTPENAKSILSHGERKEFMTAKASIIAADKVKKANEQASYLANVAETVGLSVWAGELEYVAPEKGHEVFVITEKMFERQKKRYEKAKNEPDNVRKLEPAKDNVISINPRDVGNVG